MILELLIAILISSLSIAGLVNILERSIHLNPRDQQRERNSVSCDAVPTAKRSVYLVSKCSISKKSEALLLYRDQKGLSLLEVVISIGVGLLLIAGVARIYLTCSRHSLTLSSWVREERVVSRIVSELTRLFEAVDGSPFDINPRVQLGANLSLQNASPNAVLQGNPKLRPALLSSSLTSIKLATHLLADITSCSASGLQRYGRACLRYLPSAASSDYQSFMLISVDAAYEGRGSMIGQGRCKDIVINLGESMLLASPKPQKHCTELLIVPIEFLQTVYQAQTGEFRLLTHRNDINVENQPLSLPQSQLQLIMRLDNFANSKRLSLELRRDSNSIFQQEQLLRFMPQATTNILFNFL